ncbi:Toll-like receptor 6 [Amphibalanus amphitrite]|uniref:Toll-like receptor 6 n=1 Tax=Amphibalanus amphitrite TaxID=1232801 RepID=A0A6A4V2D1_AMPAM|nr:Toll-like receptor 6 [Amphibalanus amphitrite]
MLSCSVAPPAAVSGGSDRSFAGAVSQLWPTAGEGAGHAPCPCPLCESVSACDVRLRAAEAACCCAMRPRVAVVRWRALLAAAAVMTLRCAADVCEEPAEGEVVCSVADLDSGSVNASRPAAVRRVELRCSDRAHLHDATELALLRHLPALESLALRDCQFSELRRSTLRHVAGLRELSVRTFQSEWLSDELKLAADCFEDMQELEALDISGNNMWSLQPGLLQKLPLLKVLNVSGNHLQQMSALRETGVGSGLQVLDLSNNGLTEVGTSDFREFVNLKELWLSSNSLSVLQDGWLTGLSRLERLDISQNQLATLPALMLNETKALKAVMVQGNNITVLPPGLLADLPQLQTINMSGNSLSAQWIRKDTFAGLLRLIVLDLSGNVLDSLSPDVFEDLSSLQVLDLSNNQLETMPAGLFTSLSNLHTLTLSGNSLSRLEPGFLAGLHVLSRLSLDNNRLTSVDDDVFANITSIQNLRMQKNELTSIPSSLRRLTNLQELNVAENNISDDTHGVLQALPHLGLLNLAGNKLRNVSVEFLANLTDVSMLDLSRNEIENVDSGAFDKATNLMAVRLDANKLRNINGLFAKLPSLLWLNVSDNQIEFFDYALIPGELRWLDIHKNQVREIGNFYNIESVIRLETLDISHNQVSLIGSSSVPDSIKYFIIASNQLTTVEPGTFENKRQLIRADLSSNQLSELAQDAVTLPRDDDEGSVTVNTASDHAEGSAKHAELLLAGNPFVCNCHMDWLLAKNATSNKRYPKVLDGDRVMCRLLHSPNHLTPLQNTKPSDFLCDYERHCFALCHCCNYVACDCEMKCPSGCTCYHDPTWNTNIVDCSRKEQVVISREIPMDATAVFADGNNIRSLDSHTFIGRKRIKVLHVNGSNVEEIQNRSLNGLSALQVLRLESNQLTTFRGFEFDGLQSLRELYLHSNRLRVIHQSTFSRLAALEVLTLHDNQLASFPVWQLVNPYLVHISLADNQWSCSCVPAARLAAFLAERGDKVIDADTVRCSEGDRPDLCGDGDPPPPVVQHDGSGGVLPAAIVSAAVLAVAALVAVLVFRFRARLCRGKVPPAAPPSVAGSRGFAGGHYSVAVVTPEVEKLYDAFVTYSAQDTRFVNEVLAPELEQATPALRLCLLRRDAPNTSYLGDAVHHCVQASRKTLLVISRNFLDNEWCRFDFKASHLDALRTSRGTVVLLYGVDRSAVEGELKTLLKGAAWVSFGDLEPWRKVRDLIPSRQAFLPFSYGKQTPLRSSHRLRANDLPMALPDGDSPSPTCSTGMSDGESDASGRLRLDPSRLPTGRDSMQQSDHPYDVIDEYGAASGVRADSELYCHAVEPGTQMQRPLGLERLGHVGPGERFGPQGHLGPPPYPSQPPCHSVEPLHRHYPSDPSHPQHHGPQAQFPSRAGAVHQHYPSDPSHHQNRSLSHSLWV